MTAPVLRLILGDQLSSSLSSLRDARPETDILMLCEVMAEASYVPHHPQKIALIFGAMRHFANELQERGFTVRYVRLDDPENTNSFESEFERAVHALKPERVIVTEPGEHRVLQLLEKLKDTLLIPLEIRDDTRFLASRADFAAWAKGRKQLRMEYFYRDLRRRYKILLDASGEPLGGQWNYDSENRHSPAKGLTIPPRPQHALSPIGQEVLELVKSRFSKSFGTLEPFNYALTRQGAEAELAHFISHLLPSFGHYQDAMMQDEPFLFHSVISAYLNIGLLDPLGVCVKAEAAYHQGLAPLPAVEGFIRQILGWREYVRGIYWHHMPDYAGLNFFNAKRPLPALYWGRETQMNCLKGAVAHTRQHAYSHHIQRLMLTGNFALLAGLDVTAVCEWYLAVYADAFEWVELPNTLGMALFADGGLMASKPYAASGKYINRMSNYCNSCTYNPAHTTEPDACPFNALYWNFIAQHEEKLSSNQRLNYTLATLRKMSPEKRAAIMKKAESLLGDLSADNL